ncbi:hypothetical protein [uncultured Ruegeria sp.]|uniref:hypothetical protein n=1 Tax=uncultured Ruegeria sp. TaxID=259304 RepID=UPI00262EE924|nr:hypothetical protein [uncultured Ruegeria sp.]
MMDVSTEVVVAVIGGGSALIGTFLGAYLNKRATLSTARELVEIERFKYAQDRIWDFRKESYTVILAHLRKASNFADKVFAGYCDEQQHPEVYFASDDRKNDDIASWSAWDTCRAVFEDNLLTLSDDFAQQFNLLVHSFRTIDDNDLPPEVAHKRAEIFSTFYPKLLRIAQDEIAPSKVKRLGETD